IDYAKKGDGGSGMKSPISSVRLANAVESMVQRSSFLWNWKLKTTLVNQGNTLSALDILYGRTFTDGSTSNFHVEIESDRAKLISDDLSFDAKDMENSPQVIILGNTI
ncbi:unnamed protein product, partial [Porites evermanni]